ncbi:MAG TPA: LytR C-terminal domain-containing protein [Actinomycetota bacterium]|nr:LytR C-terminal domain-containing protein [Actinomycetota bacterium]
MSKGWSGGRWPGDGGESPQEDRPSEESLPGPAEPQPVDTRDEAGELPAPGTATDASEGGAEPPRAGLAPAGGEPEPAPPRRGRRKAVRLKRPPRMIPLPLVSRLVPRRLVLAAAIGLMVLTVVASYLVLDFDPVRPPARSPAPGAVNTQLVLLSVGADTPGKPAMALLYRGPAESTLVLIPATTVVEVPGLGPRYVSAATSEGGPRALETSVAVVLGTRVPSLLQAGAAQTSGLVDVLGGVVVDVPETVEIEDAGTLRPVFTRGVARMSGASFLEFMSVAVPGQSEPDRLARQAVGWRALFSSLRARGAELRGSLEPWEGNLDGAAAADILSSAAAKPLQVLTLPVNRLASPGEESYSVNARELDVIHRELDAVRTVRHVEGRRVRLLVGADGAVGPAVAAKLVEAGFVVKITGTASRRYDASRVVVPLPRRGELNEAAQEILGLIGMGTVAVTRLDQSAYDVTVVIGRDWAAANGFTQSAAPPPPPAARP